MTTEAEAFERAGECIAEAYAKLLDPANSDADCARAAYRSTGPSLDELVDRIRAWRDEHGVIRKQPVSPDAVVPARRRTTLCSGSGQPGTRGVDSYPCCPVCGREFGAQGRKAQARLGNCWAAVPRHYQSSERKSA